MKKRTTINDIAREAGVSRQTVSRAINGMNGISAETRERVLKTVEELGFRPNRLAQGMVNSQTHTIGLIIGNITNPAHAEVVSGIQDKAQDNNYNIVLRSTDNEATQQLEAIKLLQAQRVDGIIILSSQLETGILETCADPDMPIVIVHRQIEVPYISSIVTDTERATKMVVSYLLGAGHTKIGIISRQGNIDIIRHINGYKAAYCERNIRHQSDWVVQAETTLDGGYIAARDLLSRVPTLTAIFTYNDAMAVGAMKACSDLGKNIPRDVAIFGYDDIALGSYVRPTLSTVRYHSHYVGKSAVERILAMRSQPETIFPPLIVDMELVLRESTAAA